MKNECITQITPTCPKLWEWLSDKIETARIEKQPVGVWLENLRVMTGEGIVITSECWSDYGLLLGAKQELLSLVQKLEPSIKLAIVMSPDFLLTGIVIVETGEIIAFTRGAAASRACVEQGVAQRVWGVGTARTEDCDPLQRKRPEKAGLPAHWLLGLFLALHPTPYTPHPAPTGLGEVYFGLTGDTEL
ncbi:hypothetical protein [Nostoc sp. CCY 9925]|uniref:hypothetical protein n=1 Tax=Nostoc sp. CCY 9925 TaxID=3103865 RepID=UPI0039C64631